MFVCLYTVLSFLKNYTNSTDFKVNKEWKPFTQLILFLYMHIVVCIHICIYVLTHIYVYINNIYIKIEKGQYSTVTLQTHKQMLFMEGKYNRSMLELYIFHVGTTGCPFSIVCVTHMHVHAYVVQPNIWRAPVSYSQHLSSVYVGYDHVESLNLMGIVCLNIPENTVPDSQRYWSPSTQSQHIPKAGWHALSQSQTQADPCTFGGHSFWD